MLNEVGGVSQRPSTQFVEPLPKRLRSRVPAEVLVALKEGSCGGGRVVVLQSSIASSKTLRRSERRSTTEEVRAQLIIDVVATGKEAAEVTEEENNKLDKELESILTEKLDKKLSTEKKAPVSPFQRKIA